jgi:hypothetical protein
MDELNDLSINKLSEIIKSAKGRNPFIVIEMKSEDLKDFQSCAKLLNFKSIPSTKIFQLRLTRNLFEIE